MGAGPSYTLQQLQAQLDALWAAYTSGELVVKYADKEVRYRSIAEIATAIAGVEAQMNSMTNSTTTQIARHRTKASFSKGLIGNNGRPWGC